LGRGAATGNGKTSGRAQKPQKPPSPPKLTPPFQRPQLPLFPPFPKPPFTNINPKQYPILNLHQLNKFQHATQLTPPLLLQSPLLNN
uniref:uL15 family ribosomal protein n=1 Tax=Staphylococcus epidermidis TaxID=1282 RepID=UPI001642591C